MEALWRIKPHVYPLAVNSALIKMIMIDVIDGLIWNVEQPKFKSRNIETLLMNTCEWDFGILGQKIIRK